MESNPQNTSLKLDELNLQRNAANLPAEMREDFLWLGAFLRDACHRDIEVLATRARALGVQHDKTTWSRILRGKWGRDAEGNETSPVISQANFLKAVRLLRSDERVREMAGKVPFIETSITKQIFNFVDGKRAPERVNRFGVVVGQTGSQKTASYKEYCRRNNHGMCSWVEAPENGSMVEFISSLAVRYGSSPQEGYQRLRFKVFQAFNDTKTIIVDNVQRLYKEKNGHNQPVFDFLSRLQDERGGTIILSITPVFERTLLEGLAKGFFEQFEGRAGGRTNFLRLPDVPPEEDVLTIAKAFGLKDADKHLDFLVKISREPGRIRRLFEDLQQAKVRAEMGKRPLTLSLVKMVRDEDTEEGQ